MLAASDNFVIDTITDIIYKTCNNGDIGENLSRFFYIALAENPGANECEIHRSLNPMNHIKKIITQILIKRAQLEVVQEHCNFIE